MVFASAGDAQRSDFPSSLWKRGETEAGAGGWAGRSGCATESAMASIVHTVHRYKRPPKRKKAVALKVGRIARAGGNEHDAATFFQRPPADVDGRRRLPAADRNPDQTAGNLTRATIFTAKRKPGRFGEAEDLTPEEYQRRGDAADAVWRELVRRATGRS